MSTAPESRHSFHDRQAPWWAAAMVVFGVLGVGTIIADLGGFWSGYLLDMTGPAWNYILFRGRFTAWADNRWTRFFTPVRTFGVFVLACFGIEGAQYLGLYDATFDPLDLVAYLSLLLPLFLIDHRSVHRPSGSGRMEKSTT